MTFTEIVDAIVDPLNITSPEGRTRVGRIVNRYYKQITAELGVSPVVRRSVDLSQAMVVGEAFATFTSTEKILRVFYLSGTTKVFLEEVLFDELRDEATVESSDTPTRWAQKSLGATSVTVQLDKKAATTYALKADGYASTSTLTGESVPAFPESFHDILIEGPLFDEWRRKKEDKLAATSKDVYDKRMSGLRLWAATSVYRALQQNGRQ